MHSLEIVGQEGLGLGLGVVAGGRLELTIQRDGSTRTEPWTLDRALDRVACLLGVDGLSWLADATEKSDL